MKYLVILFACAFSYFALADADKIYKVSYSWKEGHDTTAKDFYLILEDTAETEGDFSLYFDSGAKDSLWMKAEGEYGIDGDRIIMKSGNTVYEGFFSNGRESMAGGMRVREDRGVWNAVAFHGDISSFINGGKVHDYRGPKYGVKFGFGGVIEQGGNFYGRHDLSFSRKTKKWVLDLELFSTSVVYRYNKGYFSMNAFTAFPLMGFLKSGMSFENVFSDPVGMVLALPMLLNSGVRYFPFGQGIVAVGGGLDYDWFHINPFDGLNRFGFNAGAAFHIWNFVLTADYLHLFSRHILKYENGRDPVFGLSLHYMFANN